MMLVSSSGWAHSPITLIFTDLSAVYGAALAPGAAPSATAAAVARTTPKRLTSDFLLQLSGPHTRAPDRTDSHRTAFVRYWGVWSAVKCVRLPSGLVRFVVPALLLPALAAPASASAAPSLKADLQTP